LLQFIFPDAKNEAKTSNNAVETITELDRASVSSQQSSAQSEGDGDSQKYTVSINLLLSVSNLWQYFMPSFLTQWSFYYVYENEWTFIVIFVQ